MPSSWPAASRTRPRRAGALTGVAKALAAAGQPERAEQLARSITKSDGQMSALTAVAKALAAAGQPERAEQLARSITKSERQLSALTEVALVLAEDGSVSARTRSRAVTAQLLIGRSWVRAMPVLAALAPAVVAAAGVAVLEVLYASGQPQTQTGT